MGQYLSTPVTEKEVADGHNDKLAYGLAAMQGWRVSMEDDHIASLNFHDNVSMFSVFDGHGGKAVAKFCAKHLITEMLKLEAFKAGDLPKAITDAYYKIDEILDTEEGMAELRELAGQSRTNSVAPVGGGGLFTHVEESLDKKGLKTSPRPSEDTTDVDKSQPKLANKEDSSSQFYDSHLKRVSVDIKSDHLRPEEVAELNNKDGGAAAATPNTNTDNDANMEAVDSGDEMDDMQGAMGVGCTAVSAIVRDNMLIVANTGDSRCVLSSKGVAVPLTLDHKPILPEEAERIINAGGFVRDNRVNGALNVSRTLGDLDFKRNEAKSHTEQMVVATPDIEIKELLDGDEFLIIACDGIWDVLSNQEAVDFVRKRIKLGVKLRQICEQMCDYCLAPDLKGLCRGADNMSVIIVLFKKTSHLDSFFGKLWGGSLRLLGLSGNTKQKQQPTTY